MITYENMHEIVKKNKPHTISSLKDIQKQILPVFNTGKFINCDRYHFNNEWVSYTLSDDEPEKTYGIIYVEKMPYINLASFGSEASFIATIDNLVYTNRLKPILLFINNRYVPWSDIEIVFDYGDTYLKIYGQKYNFFTIRKVDMLEIPFPVCTASIENDYVFNCNFNAMKKYLQENSYMVGDNIHLKIPTLNTIYNHINIGVWYYNQLKLDRLGLLSKDRKDLLSYILININGKSNKVNLFDRDSYKRYIVEDMVNYFMDDDGKISNVLFRFDDNGYFNPSGNHIIATTNQNVKLLQRTSNISPITGQVNLNDIENSIFETNFPILFKNRMLNTSYSVDITAQNTYTISNAENSVDYDQDGTRYKKTTGNDYDYFIFYNEELSRINNFNFKFPNTQYAFKNPDIDVSLDFDISDNHILFEDYHDESVNTLINFDLREFNELYKTSVYSTCITGTQFNQSLSFPLGNNDNYGLKIPRMKVNDRETFALIFINGLLMKSYDTMVVYPNYLFFTVYDLCNDNDNVEILYFTKCNNNQLTVKYTDDETLKSRLFTDDEVKYFTTDLHDSLTYPEVLKEYDNEEIAFPIYKYNDDNSVSIIDDLEELKTTLVVTNSENTKYSKVYDDKNRVIRYTNFLNQNYFYMYDEDDHVIRIISNNADIQYIYKDGLLSAELSNAIDAAFSYDINGVAIPLFNGKYRKDYIYDDNKLLIMTKDTNEEIHEYEYDSNNNLIKETIISSDSTIINTYEYDNNNNVIKSIENDKVSEFEYDGNNNVVKSIIDGVVRNITYDQNNNKILDEIEGINKISYEYDSDNRVIKKSSNVNEEILDEYYKYIDGKLAYITRSDNTWEKYDYQVFRNVTVVSKNKFVYERLIVDQKSYKIRIDGKRFKYCDNQKQYVLFVNGRRVYNKNFLITIPKTTRPFDAMYLYTSNFVTPEDQIDLFYIPMVLYDDEITNTIGINGPVQIDGGYMKFNKTKLNYPMDPKLFILFINGKKIAPNNLISVSSNIVRFTKDPYTTKDISITLLVDEFIPEVQSVLNDISIDSKFDSLINDLSKSNYNEIDKLYSQYITVSNIENNFDADPNIGMIAIANEIVRDFWVANGYDYAGKNPFVYDYYSDQYTSYDENNNLLIPALDANREININKDDLHHLYLSLTTDEFNLNNIFIINNKDTFDKVNYLELGAKLINPVLEWEYADTSENMTPLISQTLNDKSLSINDRSYSFNNTFDSDVEFTLIASDKYATCESKLTIKFASPIYYGLIDEDLLDKRDSDIYTKNPLDMMDVLTKSIQPNASLYLDDYIIGNNKYFVAIIPRKYVYDENGKFKITFFLPNINDEAVIKANRDDHTTPILTNGKLEKDSTMVSLENYEMNIMVDNISFTNKYGYTEDYVIFKSNGYFTRLYDNFGFNIAIK